MRDKFELDVELGRLLALVVELHPMRVLFLLIHIAQKVLSARYYFIFRVLVLVPHFNRTALAPVRRQRDGLLRELVSRAYILPRWVLSGILVHTGSAGLRAHFERM